MLIFHWIKLLQQLLRNKIKIYAEQCKDGEFQSTDMAFSRQYCLLTSCYDSKIVISNDWNCLHFRMQFAAYLTKFSVSLQVDQYSNHNANNGKHRQHMDQQKYFHKICKFSVRFQCNCHFLCFVLLKFPVIWCFPIEFIFDLYDVRTQKPMKAWSACEKW